MKQLLVVNVINLDSAIFHSSLCSSGPCRNGVRVWFALSAVSQTPSCWVLDPPGLPSVTNSVHVSSLYLLHCITHTYTQGKLR